MTPPELPDWPGRPGWQPPQRRPDLIPGVGVPARERAAGPPDAYAGLLARRTVFLRGVLDEQRASELTAELMMLDGVSDEPVTLLVNSGGGPLPAVFAVLDTIRLMRAPVVTVCVGQAAGTAAAVLVLGTGGREAAPSATISLRIDVRTELAGGALQVQQQVEHLASLRDRLADLLASASALPLEVVRDDLDSGRPLGVEEALASRLIDRMRRALGRA
jgi:ATP-dependent Clp protease, protease subunit